MKKEIVIHLGASLNPYEGAQFDTLWRDDDRHSPRWFHNPGCTGPKVVMVLGDMMVLSSVTEVTGKVAIRAICVTVSKELEEKLCLMGINL